MSDNQASANPANGSGDTLAHADVVVYSSDYCPYCMMAKRLLAQLGVTFTEHKVDGKPAVRQEMMDLSGAHTVPQIFIGKQPIGGSDDLHALHSSGKLQPLLFPAS